MKLLGYDFGDQDIYEKPAKNKKQSIVCNCQDGNKWRFKMASSTPES